MSTHDDAWQAACTTMHARAWWKLHHSHQLEPHHGYPWLQVWDTATGFDTRDVPAEPTLFSVFRPDHSDPIVRRAIWRRRGDLDRVRAVVVRTGRSATTEPTLEIAEAPLGREPLEGLLAEARGFVIPVAWEVDDPSVTCDASRQGFAFANPDLEPTAVLRLEWSSEIPPAWEPFREWYRRLSELLEGAFPIEPGSRW